MVNEQCYKAVVFVLVIGTLFTWVTIGGRLAGEALLIMDLLIDTTEKTSFLAELIDLYSLSNTKCNFTVINCHLNRESVIFSGINLFFIKIRLIDCH